MHRTWLGLLASLVLWAGLVVAPSASAQQCLVNGGTRAGCFPAKVVFSNTASLSSNPTLFASFEGALAYAMRSMRNSTLCTGYEGGQCKGLSNGALEWNGIGPLSGSCGKGYSAPPDFEGWSRSTMYGTRVSYRFSMYGHGQRVVDCGDGPKAQNFFFHAQYWDHITGFVQCPVNHTALLEHPNQWSGNYGYYCAPNATQFGAITSRSRPTCQDGPNDGCGTAGNPVELIDGTKVDVATDLVVAGDFPIQWQRTFSSQQENLAPNGWSFLTLKRSDVGRNASTGKSVAYLNRGDGSVLAFEGTGQPGSRAWVVRYNDLAGQSRIHSTLSDWSAGGSDQAVVLTQGNGTREFYDGQGRLVKVTNAQGRSHSYLYNAAGLVSKITQDNGRYLAIAYGTMGFPAQTSVSLPVYDQVDDLEPSSVQTVEVAYVPYGTQPNDAYRQPVVTSVTDGTRTVSYGWAQATEEEGPRLVSVTDPSGGVRTFHYNESPSPVGSWTGWTDADGRRMATYVMGSSGRLEQEWKGAGPQASQNAQKIDRLSFSQGYLSDGNGYGFGFSASYSSSKMYSYTRPCPWCSGNIQKQFVYRDDGRYEYTVGFNDQRTQYTYDGQGNVASITEAATSSTPRVTSFTWASPTRYPLTQTEQVRDHGTLTTRVTAWTYNARWQPLTQSVTSTDNGVTRTRTHHFAYGSDERLASITDPQGVVTTFHYNAAGDLIARERGAGTPGAQRTRWGGYQADGLPRWSIDAWGVLSVFEWDQGGRLLQSAQWVATGLPSDDGLGATAWTPPSPPAHARLTSYQHSAAGRLERLDLTDGTFVTFDYDAAGRLTQFQTFGVTDQLVSRTVLTLDVMSNVTQVEVRGANNQAVAREQRVFDEQRRIRQILNAAGQALYTQTYNTEHQPTTRLDALARQDQQDYDALGRLVTFLDAQNQAHQLTHGPQDEVLTATDARGVVTTYTYNGFGDLTGLTSPDRGNSAFGFDAQGRHTTTTDPRGVVVSTSFDALSRPIVRTFSDAGVSTSAAGFEPGNVVQTFVYDACPNGQSRLCQITDASGTTAYTYNPWGEVVGKAWTGKTGGPAAGITLSSGYGYEAATGRLASITFPSGKTQTVAYGNDGQPLSLAYAGQGVVANVAWTATGQVAGWSWPQATGWSGIHSSVSFTYDLDGRPTQINDLDQRTLAWDVGDRLVGVDDPADASRSQLYGYDSLDRLTSADIGAWSGPVAFSYDAGGNRTSVSDSQGGDSWQYAYGLASNRLVSQSSIVGGSVSASFVSAYDAMGNLVSDGIGLQLSYDATGRLARGAKGPQEMTARYNALGQRMVKASGSQTRVYAVDEMGRPLGVYVLDATASNGFRVEEEYVHLDGWRPVAVIRPDAATGMANPQVFPILSDHLGTPRKVLDGATGQTRWAWDAKQPFGHEMPLETPTVGLPAFTLDLRFPGQRFDEETGLFHNGFRDYHPGLGRYVQSDPLGLEAGWNTYGYVNANPLGNTDSRGLRIDVQAFNDPRFMEALRYLSQSKTGQEVIQKVVDSKRVLKIEFREGFDTTVYNNRRNTILWNPEMGLHCEKSGLSINPSVLLIHEMVHFTQYEDPSFAYEMREIWNFRNPTWSKSLLPWTNGLEMDAIGNYENKISRDLGGLNRHSHDMSGTSIRPALFKTPSSQKPYDILKWNPR